MKDIVAIGEVLIDLTQVGVNEQGVPQFSANPGGAPANLAVAAAKLGASTAFIGKVGDDSYGSYLRSVLNENGVDTSGMLTDKKEHTTLAVVSVDETGERSFSFYREPSADVNLKTEELSEDLLKQTKILHFGSVSLTAEPSKSATLNAAKIAKENGALVSYDPNYRASLWSSEKKAVKEMKAALPLCDILKISDEELPLLTGTEDPEAGSAMLAKEYDISLVFITLGANGAFFRLGEQTGSIPGIKVKVGDTNGAGDTFFGAALSKIVNMDFANLTIEQVREIAVFANKAASITTSRHGAIPAMPTLHEVENVVFNQRLQECYDELKWLYCELYKNDETAFGYFMKMLEEQFNARKDSLRALDEKRLAEPDWYRSNKLMGMMMYPENFGGNLKGVQEKLDYLEECGINYLHLMPLLDSPKGKSDGGYAVSDFRKVRPDLGTMDDLSELADACHDKGIVLCLDFVLNHTSEEHAWAKAARAGDTYAQNRYFFYDNWDIPNVYEKTVPQVFPTTAPGNFTELETGKVVMTSFYPFQWDLNYANPMVFNDMCENLLFLANQGMDVIRLDAVPYIWKELGTDCRNLPQVHTLVRMMHLAVQIVCPSVLLLGEVVMEPKKVAPYFGTPAKPECDMLYNVTTMCTTWHTVATRDARLLKRQMKQLVSLPKSCLFQNYLRCHDDIGWGLDYPWLERYYIGEVPHKKYINDWFTGRWPGSWAKGELYNDDPRLGDARLCGTTASLIGLEKAVETGDKALFEQSMNCFQMLHAWMMSQSGVPVIYSGDEIAQFNDNHYKENPDKVADSRYLHRGIFDWEKASLRKDLTTVQGKALSFLRILEVIRAKHPAFRSDAEVEVLNTGNDGVLGISRSYEDDELVLLFNFSENPASVNVGYGNVTNLITGKQAKLGKVQLPGYGFAWLQA